MNQKITGSVVAQGNSEIKNAKIDQSVSVNIRVKLVWAAGGMILGIMTSIVADYIWDLSKLF